MNTPSPFSPGRFFLLGFFLIIAIVLADQYTKWLVMETMLRINGDAPEFSRWFMTENKIPFFITEREPFRTIALLPFLNFVMVWNQGISFGLFDTNDPRMPILFIGISLLISIPMLIWLTVSRRIPLSIGLSLIIGGAFGNVIDRVRFGAVADFIDLHMNNRYHWPAFNLADSCIVIGALLLIYDAFTSKSKSTLPG